MLARLVMIGTPAKPTFTILMLLGRLELLAALWLTAQQEHA